MVRVDDVYQKVLAFANKEQRGYITPQEFNLFADQAQREIFEQYFYDLNQFSRVPGNSSEYSDIVDNINEKIAAFEAIGTSLSLAPNIYRLGTVTADGREVEEVQPNELLYMNNSAISRPTNSRRVYVRTGPLAIAVTPVALSGVNYTFIRLPARPTWGYVVVGTKALWDGGTNSTDFELHASEETELVYKILKYAGLSMKRDDIAKGGQGLESLLTQQEKQ
tara:strand:- start:1288 stop:1953 length:666 start_codon:yes stop_codon:yes gene_type:complete